MTDQIRRKTPIVTELVNICKEETKCGNCTLATNSVDSELSAPSEPKWINLVKNVTTNPPKNTVAVVVDVRTGRGALNIHNTNGDQTYVDKVGPGEEGGDIVLVPWKDIWYFYSIGTVRVAYIVKA